MENIAPPTESKKMLAEEYSNIKNIDRIQDKIQAALNKNKTQR